MLQCVAACCSTLQCIAVCCSALQCVAVRCSALQCVVVFYIVVQCVAHTAQTLEGHESDPLSKKPKLLFLFPTLFLSLSLILPPPPPSFLPLMRTSSHSRPCQPLLFIVNRVLSPPPFFFHLPWSHDEGEDYPQPTQLYPNKVQHGTTNAFRCAKTRVCVRCDRF